MSFPASFSCFVPRPAQRLGELHVVVSLEDWGPLNLPKASQVQDSSSTAPTAGSYSDTAQPSQPSRQPPTSPRETPEYKVAMELEIWKEQQESFFEEQVCVM